MPDAMSFAIVLAGALMFPLCGVLAMLPISTRAASAFSARPWGDDGPPTKSSPALSQNCRNVSGGKLRGETKPNHQEWRRGLASLFDKGV
jgi:hypothetical protein